MGGGGAKVVKEISTGSDTRTPAFIFLQSVVNCVPRVGHMFIWWDFVFINLVQNINSVD